MSKKVCTWTTFKHHSSKTGKQHHQVLKASDRSMTNQQANNKMTRENISGMSNAAMGTFVNVAEESIHADIKSRFSSLTEKYKAYVGAIGETYWRR